MKKRYLVKIYYLPGTPADKRGQNSKDDYHYFDTFKEAELFIQSIDRDNGLGIEKVTMGRMGGFLHKDEKGESVFAKYCIRLSSGFLLENIVQSVQSREMRVDGLRHNEHTFQSGDRPLSLEESCKFEEYIREQLARRLAQAKKQAEDLPTNSVALDPVFNLIEVGDTFEIGAHCWDCNDGLDGVLVDVHTIALISKYKSYLLREKLAPNKTAAYEYKLTDLSLLPVCGMSELNIEDKVAVEIDVPTGDLVFANFFRDEKTLDDFAGEDNETDRSICGLLGRVKLAKYYSTINVGYGQMGNMSLNVFLKEDGTEIILGREHGYDEVKDREFTVKHKGFKNIGNISLSMWRWMCADKEVLSQRNISLPKLKKNSTIEHDYRNYTLAKVKPGKWIIEHYYDLHKRNDADIIFSRLYLKN